MDNSPLVLGIFSNPEKRMEGYELGPLLAEMFGMYVCVTWKFVFPAFWNNSRSSLILQSPALSGCESIWICSSSASQGV